MDMETS
jgi:ATP-binding cassette, subfamily A (ABC1), member 3